MKKIIACIGTFFALVALSTQAKNPYLLQTADQSAMEHWVDSVFESLSPKERIAQLLVITVRNSDTPQNRKTLQRLIQGKNRWTAFRLRNSKRPSQLNKLLSVLIQSSPDDHS